ncbi:MAG: hypothetical protein ABEJ98_05510 [Candidatus Nanohaloarchaea archaeon]
MDAIQSSTVDAILEEGEPVETALQQEAGSSPETRKALYGYQSEVSGNDTLPVAGSTAVPGYAAAGIPGGEALANGVNWYAGLPQDWQALAAIGICLGIGVGLSWGGAAVSYVLE